MRAPGISLRPVLAGIAWLALLGCGDLAPADSDATTAVDTSSDATSPDTLDTAALDTAAPDLTDTVSPSEEPLTITALDPAEGPAAGGIDVLVQGTGFEAGLEVLFDQSPAPEVFVIGPHSAVVRLPPHPSARVAVTLLHPDRPGVAATLPAAFRYVDTIAVSAVEPVSGLVDGGIPVTVRGRGFTPDTRVFFAGRPALTQRVVDTETVTGVLPPGVFGAADVHAVGLNGTAELADAFFYGAAPTLERLDPITGPAAGGTRVTLSGSGLGPESVVSFGDRPAEVV